MMAPSRHYTVEFTVRARKQLKTMDRFDARLIATWIKGNLDGCTNPRAFRKGLSANRSGEWRYHVGAYRILVLIDEGTITIEVFSIGHRREIYRD